MNVVPYLPTVTRWVACIAALYHIFVVSRLPSYLDLFIPLPWHRAVSLFSLLTLVFLTYSGSGQTGKIRLSLCDIFLLLLGWTGVGFMILFYERVNKYWEYGFLDLKGVILVFLLTLAILEAVRRVVGWILPIILTSFILMTLFQNHLPGLLYGKAYAPDRLGFNFYGVGGIFGVPLGVASTIIIVFLIFAAFLQASGAGEWFAKLAIAMAGWTRGGAAKAAVIASAFFGTISGSPAGNVATTGAITIPLMIKTGYQASFAGAVESVASTGGQILPPIMGAIAFIMAEWLGKPYHEVAIAAALPAAIYFVVLFMSVHFEAARIGLPALPRSQIPAVIPTLKEGWFYLLPIAVLVYFLLVRGFPPDMSALITVPVTIGCSFINKDKNKRLYPGRLVSGLIDAVRRWVTPATVCAGVGMLIACMELSGLGIKVTRVLLELSGGRLVVALPLIGLAAYVLGMGLDSIPAYITLAVLVAPALINLGISDMAAHLYVVYWGLSSFITPPVCIAVYVACGLSGANVWKTGWQAMRLAPAIFLVPFIFALQPALMLRGTMVQNITAAITSIIGAISIASGIRGYGLRYMNWPQRLLSIIGGTALLWTSWKVSLTGLILVAISLLWQQFVPFRAQVHSPDEKEASG